MVYMSNNAEIPNPVLQVQPSIRLMCVLYDALHYNLSGGCSTISRLGRIFNLSLLLLSWDWKMCEGVVILTDILVAFLIPAVLVAFYIGLNWPFFKDSRIQQAVVGLGILLYYAGLVYDNINPKIGSLLRLSGASIFLVLVLYQAIKQRK